jgi:hypothetical protein
MAFRGTVGGNPKGLISTEAVRKLLRVFTRACFVRFCEALERSESKKSRKISLCSIVYKIFAEFSHRLDPEPTFVLND